MICNLQDGDQWGAHGTRPHSDDGKIAMIPKRTDLT